jgi:uncharacterized LabA/DUF88 family protein
MKTAIFIDGAFFLKRISNLYERSEKVNLSDAASIVKELYSIVYKHLIDREISKKHGRNQPKHELYRIFFYDCPPLEKKLQYPISKKNIDFSKTEDFKLRTNIHNELKKGRKTALRLGRLQDFGGWTLKQNSLKELLKGTRDFSSLEDKDFRYEIRQKSVDMKIGVDIASVAYKGQAERIY